MKNKRVYVSLLILFSCLQPASPQGTYSSDLLLLDSLRFAIDKHHSEDETKVRLLNDYAIQSFYSLNYKEGLIAARDARALSQKIGYSGGEILNHISLATCLYRHEMHQYHSNSARLRSYS